MPLPAKLRKVARAHARSQRRIGSVLCAHLCDRPHVQQRRLLGNHALRSSRGHDVAPADLAWLVPG